MKLNLHDKHDDFCPCTRFHAQDEFCTCGAIERAAIVADVGEAFGKRLRQIERVDRTALASAGEHHGN